MEFKTTHVWDEDLWNKARVVYAEAFGKQGAKSTAVIQNMFRKQMCSLHVAIVDSTNKSEVIGMAITAEIASVNCLIIDYLAVRSEFRHKGVGSLFVDYIINWAKIELKYDSILLEIEATDTPIHNERVKFWEKCGFQLLDYIHDYKVVPEPYQAMFHKLTPHAKITTDGKELFKYLAQFHRKCFRGVT